MTGCEFNYRDKISIAILGATGSVGQKFVQLLAHHPWFEITALTASKRSVGRPYGEAAAWQMPVPLPEPLAAMNVQPCRPPLNASIVFSGLDSSVAGDVETAFAEAGFLVISNSKNHRMDLDVPLVIPEVNSAHLDLLQRQPYGKGKIVTNPNCSVIGLATALKPLDDAFGVEAVHVVTMQAISGAGFRKRGAMDIDDNVLPWIESEEEKIATELQKILGTCADGSIAFRNIAVSAQCNRVPVSDGHTQCVSVKLKRHASEQDIVRCWQEFDGGLRGLKLPTMPKPPVKYWSEPNFPQPKLHRNTERGMSVSVGRLRRCPILDYKFVSVSHNTVRGAAGGAILIAELMTRKGLVWW